MNTTKKTLTGISAIAMSLATSVHSGDMNHAHPEVKDHMDASNAEASATPENRLQQESSRRMADWFKTSRHLEARLHRADESVQAEGREKLDEIGNITRRWQGAHVGLASTNPDTQRKSLETVSKAEQDLQRQVKEFDSVVPKDVVDYRRELEEVVSEVDQAEEDIANRLEFLGNRREMLKDLRSELKSLQDEAEEHLSTLEDTDENNWSQVKGEIDDWMNENFQEMS